MHHSEAVKGVILEVKLLVALSSKDHEQSKLSVLFQVQVLESCLLLEERYYDRLLLDLIGNLHQIVSRFLVPFQRVVQLRDQ